MRKRLVGALSVLQVPEECAWNPYVAAAESALAGCGAEILRPGLCRDNPIPSSAADVWSTVAGVRPDIVHLHWPDKLARQYGVAVAVELVRTFRAGGARIVQTVHNLAPHEPTGELAAFARQVDMLTDGVHFFSPEHEAAARSVRPDLPRRVLYLPHPLLPAPPAGGVFAEPDALSVGCFGRLRAYKRTVPFTRAFLAAAPPGARLVVAGAPDDVGADRALGDLAAADARLDYRPGFRADHGQWWRLLTEVACVALPYRLYSSGVLVAALQARRRVLSPVPVGGTGLYVRGEHHPWWTALPGWDDERAVRAWLGSARSRPAAAADGLALPSWPWAADRLAAFYADLGSPLVPVGAVPARVGIR